MTQHEYELTTDVGKFSEGDVLELTEQYGSWHIYDVKLSAKDGLGAIELTEEELGQKATPVVSA